ncbi:probable magnesium transporter NIPA2 [Musa acuminata AAA Group]|uniref:probable magnesium transporter NIPA2 n=1 Tax=Musa acuminata AAA Group TaxID=214697 RepID=UPI0031D3E2A0
MGVSVDNIRGLVLAMSSSIFIGSSFIVKKKGLKRAGAYGVSAGSGGFSYLYEPLWWAGMLTMILGEAANFAAYAFAPAILVTPLGALSIIVSAVLAHFMLNEKLHIFGVLGCVLCVVGSTSIVLHAPIEKDIESVKEVWYLATEPGFISYACVVLFLVIFFIVQLVPRYGQTHMVIYVGICSLMGSLTVMSVKAVGIALKLTFSGMNQFVYVQTWIFILVVVMCCLMQMNYLNKCRGAAMKVAYFENRSITTSIDPSPSIADKLDMKSKKMLSHDLSGMGNGSKSPTGFRCSTLSCWQVRHVRTYSSISVLIFGQ